MSTVYEHFLFGVYYLHTPDSTPLLFLFLKWEREGERMWEWGWKERVLFIGSLDKLFDK